MTRKTTTPPAPAPRIDVDHRMIAVPTHDTGLPALRRIDGQLTPRQAKALRTVFDGLQLEGATVRLGGTYPVRSHVDAIRWLLDAVADAQGID